MFINTVNTCAAAVANLELLLLLGSLGSTAVNSGFDSSFMLFLSVADRLSE